MLIYTGFRVLYAFVKKKMKKKHFITLKKLASRTRPLSIPSLIPNILSSGIQTFIRPININKKYRNYNPSSCVYVILDIYFR